MKYIAFQKALKIFPVFSVSDIYKALPDFDNRRLVEWQNKGYILKIRRGYYCFADRLQSEGFLKYAANKIYNPSYVSLESGLAYYGLIPEETFMVTSVSSRNTAEFQTSIGNFRYRHFKKGLFFGYQLVSVDDIVYRIGEVEKVILDYLYFSKIDSYDKMEGVRFNSFQIMEVVDFENLSEYQSVFKSKVLDKRVKIFKKIINA